MWPLFGLICAFCLLLTAVIVLSVKIGSKNAELEVLIEAAKERNRANKIIDNVRHMAHADVRERLQDTHD